MFVEYCGQVSGSFPTKAFMALIGIAEMPTLPSALSAGDISCTCHARVMHMSSVVYFGCAQKCWLWDPLVHFGTSQFHSSGRARALLWVNILHETQMTQMTQISQPNNVHVNHSHFQPGQPSGSDCAIDRLAHSGVESSCPGCGKEATPLHTIQV